MRYGHSICIGQTVVVEMDISTMPPSVLPPSPSISISGAYSDGQSIGDVVVSVTGETSGLPPLQSGIVKILADSNEQGASYVLSAGETLTAEFSWVHVTGAGRVVSAPVEVGPTSPAQFVPAGWSVAPVAGGGAAVAIFALPDDGGSAIGRIDYRVNGGDPVPAGGTSDFAIVGLSPGTQQIQIRAANAAGVGQWSTAKPVTILSVTPTNPMLVLGEQQPGTGGAPDSVPITFTYGGTDIVDLYVATGPTAFAVSEAEMRAQSGGAATEFAVSLGYDGGEIELSGLTDDSVDDLVVLAMERNLGGSSGLQRLALTDIDFTALAVTSAETDADDGTRIFLTMNDDVLGSPATSFWTVPGHVVSAVSIVGSLVTLTVQPAIASSDSVTVSYASGDLTDERGNPLEAFLGRAVTNNVPGGITPVYLASYNQATDLSTTGTSAQTTPAVFPAADTYVVCVTDVPSGATLLALGGAAVLSASRVIVGGNAGSRCAIYVVTTSGASDLTLTITSAGTISLDRQIHVIRATGATAAGSFGTADGGGAAAAPYDAQLASACDVGDFIVAVTLCRNGQATGITWSGVMAGNELADVQQASAQHRSGVAAFIADSATAHTATTSYDNNDASFDWSLVIAAIKAA
jgi:hypothetical protein